MTKQVSVSRDGSWKIEVEAFKINLFVYNAIVESMGWLDVGNFWHVVQNAVLAAAVEGQIA